MSIVIDETTTVVVQGATGWTASRHVEFMLEYGTKIVAGVTPGRAGEEVSGVPIYDSIDQAQSDHGPIDLAVGFVPGHAAAEAGIQAVEAGVRVILMTTEGVPARDALRLLERVRDSSSRLIGPNSQGAITPGRAKIGGTGGDRAGRMFTSGRIGVISRSGGMGAETCWALSRAGLGQSTYIAIGGEVLSGCGFADLAIDFQNDPETDAIVCFGESGGVYEERLAEAVADGLVTKPVIAYVVGDFLEAQEDGISFGHAGAIVVGDSGSPSAKRSVLREAGVQVAERWRDIPQIVRDCGLS